MNTTHRILGFAACLLLVLSSENAAAHSDEELAKRATPHGGELKMSGLYHFELVVQPGGLQVFVTNHADTEIPTDGWTGEAVILAGTSKSSIELKADGGNHLRGQGSVPAAAGRQIVIVMHPKPGESQSARYAAQALSAGGTGKP